MHRRFETRFLRDLYKKRYYTRKGIIQEKIYTRKDIIKEKMLEKKFLILVYELSKESPMTLEKLKLISKNIFKDDQELFPGLLVDQSWRPCENIPRQRVAHFL
jgi:hypothetical protein